MQQEQKMACSLISKTGNKRPEHLNSDIFFKRSKLGHIVLRPLVQLNETAT